MLYGKKSIHLSIMKPFATSHNPLFNRPQLSHIFSSNLIRLYDFLLSNQNSSLPVQQQIDRWYENP